MVFVKKSTFCKGVSPWFLSKTGRFSHMFVLIKERLKNTFFDILDRKKCCLDLKSEVLKKSKKPKLCKGVSSCFLSKNRRFFHFFLLIKESQKETFFDILDRKKMLFRSEEGSSKITKFKKSTFCKGVSGPYTVCPLNISHFIFFI